MPVMSAGAAAPAASAPEAEKEVRKEEGAKHHSCITRFGIMFDGGMEMDGDGILTQEARKLVSHTHPPHTLILICLTFILLLPSPRLNPWKRHPSPLN